MVANDRLGARIRERDRTAVGLGADLVPTLVDVHDGRPRGNRGLRQEERDLVGRGPIEVESDAQSGWSKSRGLPSREKMGPAAEPQARCKAIVGMWPEGVAAWARIS